MDDDHVQLVFRHHLPDRTDISVISTVDFVIPLEIQYGGSCSLQTANPLTNMISLAPPLFESRISRRRKSLDWYDLVSRKLYGHVQVTISPPYAES